MTKPLVATEDYMAAWEAILSDKKLLEPLQALDRGMAQLRSDLTRVMPAVNEAYEVAVVIGYDDSYDWEFLPTLFTHAMTRAGADGFFDELSNHAARIAAQMALDNS